MADRAYLERLSKELADKGKLIEAGWYSLRALAIPLNAPATQLEEMHMAYMAGAQHLFASMMTIMEPGDEPTEKDLARMDLINKELEIYRKILAQRGNQSGHA